MIIVQVMEVLVEVTDGIDLPTDERFYDKYDYSISNATYNRGILGDATKEMGPFQSMTNGAQLRYTGSWYDDESSFAYNGNPWFYRGGAYSNGSGSGVFAFYSNYGHAGGWVGFRLVLAF